MVENKKLIIEIIILSLFLVFAIPICVSASNQYSEKEKYLEKVSRVYISLENGEGEVSNDVVSHKTIVISNENNISMKVSIVFKIAKYTNSYTLKLDNNTYDLSKIEYTEDDNYYYYNLGLFDVDKQSKLDFKLLLNNDISYDNSVSYSFIVSGV